MRMPRLLVLLLLFSIVSLFLAGCNSGKQTTFFYDTVKVCTKKTVHKSGNVSYTYKYKKVCVKKLVQEGTTPIQQIIESTKHKSLIRWGQGYKAGLEITTITPEKPFPMFDMYLRKIDGGFGSFHKDLTAADIGDIIRATMRELKVNNNGISDKGPVASKKSVNTSGEPISSDMHIEPG